MIPEIITKLQARQSLNEDEAWGVVDDLLDGKVPEQQIVDLLTAWKEKGVCTNELFGAARAMREWATPISVKPGLLVDTCGTGGDRLDTFNISTVAALIVAGAGVRVAKHGNRGATSRCGSADLLEELGVKIDVEPPVVARCIDEIGFGFLFAPRFHPAMKHVAPIRKKLGFRTIFNLLGPLTNPAKPTHQLVGVSNPLEVEMVAEVLQRFESESVLVAHGIDEHMDEVSTVGPTRLVKYNSRGKVFDKQIVPEDFGFQRASLTELEGRDKKHCAEIALAILNQKPGPYREATLLNAGCALYLCDKSQDIQEGIALATKALDSGRAEEVLDDLKVWTKTWNSLAS